MIVLLNMSANRPFLKFEHTSTCFLITITEQKGSIMTFDLSQTSTKVQPLSAHKLPKRYKL